MSKFNRIKKNNAITIEHSTFWVYSVLLIIVSFFHEHWFDEVEAWFISSDASLKTILTEITHNEGHPPLWYLLLKPLAILGVPCDIGLFIVNDVFMVTAVFILIKYSPFSKVIKCLIPFTYFFFYQYGVICRPYCIMVLGFVLAATFYEKRDDRPFRYILALLLICSSSAYGIVISAGICISWLLDIFLTRNEVSFREKTVSFIKGKVCRALALLLIINIIYLLLIIPKNNTIAIVMSSKESLFERLMYTLFILPANGFFIFTYGRSYALQLSLDSITRIGDLFAGIVFMSIILIVAWYYKRIKELLIPFIMFAVFSAYVYFYTHHIGIYTIFLLYFFWCCMKQKDCRRDSLQKVLDKINNRQKKLIKNIANIAIFGVLLISIYWSIVASINDINHSYAIGKEIADFVDKYNIDRYRCMARWEHAGDYTETDNDFVNINGTSIDCITSLVYMDSNIYFNHNFGSDEVRYRQHCVNTDISIYDDWKKDGLPDFVFGMDAPIGDVYTGKSIDSDYTLIKVIYSDMCWKSELYRRPYPIYIRNDFLNDFSEFKDLGDISDYE